MPDSIADFFHRMFDLRKGAEQKSVIIENIKDDIEFNSARIWTLVFAVGVASVGLNINSIPVVIGAMLISPLMGPIVSAGLSLAINDWGLLHRSLRNLLIQTLITIVISALYFSLTPITNAQSELLARTQPTIFDVLIALFGGLAGFIGLSRSKQSNVIPGVAIATALMPPLCTVGYGVATLQPTFVFGALYLFLINCIFICLATLFISKYLKLPKVEYPDAKHQRRVRRIITWIIVIIVLPAIYLAYTFVERNNFYQHADQFIHAAFESKGSVIVYKKVVYDESPHVIELAFLSDHFSDTEVSDLTLRLLDFGLTNTVLKIKQNGFALSQDEWSTILANIQNDDERMRTLEAKLASEHASFSSPGRIFDEARAFDDRITNIAVGTLSFATTTSDATSALVLVYTASSTFDMVVDGSTQKITDWLKARLGQENVFVHFIAPQVPATVFPETSETEVQE